MWQKIILMFMLLVIWEGNAEEKTQPDVEISVLNDDIKWDISISPFEPYFWLANTSADATLAGNELPIDLDFFEHAMDNMGEGLQFRIELHLFAKKNKWTVIIDPTRLKADSTQAYQSTIFTTDSTFKMSDFKIGYEVNSGVDLFMGARYTSQDLSINSEQLSRPLHGSHHWWSPVVGIRYKYDFNKLWHLSTGIFLGGLQRSANDDYTSSANILLTYNHNDWLDIIVGYRVLQLQLTRGSGPTLFKYDSTYSGPLIGIKLDLF